MDGHAWLDLQINKVVCKVHRSTGHPSLFSFAIVGAVLHAGTLESMPKQSFWGMVTGGYCPRNTMNSKRGFLPSEKLPKKKSKRSDTLGFLAPNCGSDGGKEQTVEGLHQHDEAANLAPQSKDTASHQMYHPLPTLCGPCLIHTPACAHEHPLCNSIPALFAVVLTEEMILDCHNPPPAPWAPHAPLGSRELTLLGLCSQLKELK